MKAEKSLVNNTSPLMFEKIRKLAYKVRPRRKQGRLLALVLLAGLLLGYANYLGNGLPSYSSKMSFSDQSGTVHGKCKNFIRQTKYDEILPLQQIANFEFNNLLYKERKYKREKLKQFKLDKAIDQNSDLGLLVDNEFNKDFEALQAYEKGMLSHIQNSKVWGMCILEQGHEIKMCDKLRTMYYPWLSGKLPNFEDWNETQVFKHRSKGACVFSQLTRNGTGIVIPILPSISKDRELDSIRRLLRVLRTTSNSLPIELIGMHSLSSYDKKRIIQMATSDSDGYGKYPKQEIWFVDLHPVLSSSAPVFASSNFVYGLSAIFNSFEDAILMTSKNIPLVEDLRTLVQTEDYEKHGVLMFQLPSKLEYKPRKFPPGFHEMERLIMDEMIRSSQMNELFGSVGVQTEEMRQIFDRDFEKVIDPTMLVIKKRNLHGLLLGLNFQLYHKLLDVRLPEGRDDDLKLSIEHLWIGQIMTGISNVHPFDAVIPGLETPRRNVQQKVATWAKEVCSSSWGQHIDGRLIYITAHQLENWRDDGYTFQLNLKERFSLRNYKLANAPNASNPQENKYEEILDTELFDKLKENPSRIEIILQPPKILAAVYNEEYHEPTQGWLQQEYDNLNDHQYWCAYDLVGTPVDGPRGKHWVPESEDSGRYSSSLREWLAASASVRI